MFVDGREPPRVATAVGPRGKRVQTPQPVRTPTAPVGGSPGSGSPAPASPAPNASKLFRPGDLDFPPPPPPLKESAGEAIYIYDDRQY